jgi:hypothetical protein
VTTASTAILWASIGFLVLSAVSTDQRRARRLIRR